MNNFTQRALTGAAFVAVLLGSIMLSPVSFIILFASVVFLGLYEFYSLAEKSGAVPQRIFGSLAGTFIFLMLSFAFYHKINFPVLILTLPILLFIFIKELFSKNENPFLNIALTILGLLYITVPFTLLAFLAFDDGIYLNHIVLGIFFLVWANDTGAYLVGVKFGRTKLYEKISPKKSWEGFIGGIISALLVSILISKYYFELEMFSWMTVALIISVFGTLGDLSESQFKRSINVKDSGSILPGHGGILDRFDALLLAVPAVFVFLYFLHYNFS